eukprot:scaffold50109_cov27-Prasinocladus_malaysianus.AAC.2
MKASRIASEATDEAPIKLSRCLSVQTSAYGRGVWAAHPDLQHSILLGVIWDANGRTTAAPGVDRQAVWNT